MAEHWQKAAVDNRTKEIAARIFRIAGETFDISDDKQCLAILRDKMGMEISEVSDESLKRLGGQGLTLALLVFEHRVLSKFESEAK